MYPQDVAMRVRWMQNENRDEKDQAACPAAQPDDHAHWKL